jgi:hypothetical protein
MLEISIFYKKMIFKYPILLDKYNNYIKNVYANKIIIHVWSIDLSETSTDTTCIG